MTPVSKVSASAGQVILRIEDLKVLLGRRRLMAGDAHLVRAVDGVSFDVGRGEILGIVGESGSGKTTLGRTILGLQRETSGRILLDGAEVTGLGAKAARAARDVIQYVHQDAGAAFDPWWSFGSALEEALAIHRIGTSSERQQRIEDVLTAVGLDPDARKRFPHELSGGQLRRMALARIMILNPKIVILDEPTSGLDMSVQAVVLNLLLELREKLDLTYLFISHDLSVVRRFCHRVAIMFQGRIVELADSEAVFAQPAHPYTRALLAAAPTLDPPDDIDEALICNATPSVATDEAGCPYAPRCEFVEVRCQASSPSVEYITSQHSVSCHRWQDFGKSGTRGWKESAAARGTIK